MNTYCHNGYAVDPETDISEEKCADAFPCDVAVSTPIVNVYRFPDKNDAEAAGAALGSRGYVSNWIVLEFKDDSLSAADRDFLGEVPDSSNTWD